MSNVIPLRPEEDQEAELEIVEVDLEDVTSDDDDTA